MKEQRTEFCLQVCPKICTDRRYQVVADTYAGLVRDRNEDSYVYAWDASGMALLTAVADGIGSTLNGDLASYAALELLVQAWRKWKLPSRRTAAAVKDFLYRNFLRINSSLFRINAVTAGESKFDSLGTTLTAAVFLDRCVVAVNAGDSPLFRIRDGIEQVTFDHNLTNEMIRSGRMSPRKAAALEHGRMLTRFVGLKEELVPECYQTDVCPGDCFVLCSDGLTLHVPSAEITQVLQSEKNLSSALKVLFRKTIQGGAGDNTTAILVKAL